MTKNNKQENLARKYDTLLKKQDAEILRLAKADEAMQEKANKKSRDDTARVYAKYKKRLDAVRTEFNKTF
jgi:hypothetical protein